MRTQIKVLSQGHDKLRLWKVQILISQAIFFLLWWLKLSMSDFIHSPQVEVSCELAPIVYKYMHDYFDTKSLFHTREMSRTHWHIFNICKEHWENMKGRGISAWESLHFFCNARMAASSWLMQTHLHKWFVNMMVCQGGKRSTDMWKALRLQHRN